MTHISGVNNRVSDVLSRDGVCDAFYAQVATDFPHVTAFQNVTSMIPSEIRSLARLFSEPAGELRAGAGEGVGPCKY
jgi:hypothetical protein